MEPGSEHLLHLVERSGSEPAEPDLQALLAVVRTMVSELHDGHGTPNVRLRSALDRDLGFDSVTRVELLSRLEHTFGVRCAEPKVLSAETVSDLWATLCAARGSAPPEASALSELTFSGAGLERVPEDLNTLTAALEWHAEQHPQRIHAHLLGDGNDESQALCYGELWQAARSIAAGLLERGVRPAEHVALMLPTGRDYLVCFLGVLCAGAVPVPLYPPTRITLLEEHLARQRCILNNAQAVLMISVAEALPLVRALKRTLPDLRAITTAAELLSSGPLPLLRHRPGDTALIQYTSGSTGDPKGVVLSHHNLLSNMRAMGQAAEVSPQDVMISWLPLYHDMGLIGGWLSALYFGFPTVLMSPLHFLSSPERWLWTIHRARGTLSCAPNFGYELCVRRIADAALAGLDLSSWRFALNGSEPVSPQTIEAFCRRFEPYGFRRGAMFPAYGLAECSVALTFPPLMRGPRVDRVLRAPLLRTGRALVASAEVEEANVASFVACGRPLAGHEVMVVDSRGRECPDRVVGGVEFRGPSATLGYFRKPEETLRLLHGEWLRTGDLGYIADGELYLTGRSKDMIIRAGQHLYPQELEEAVGNLTGIRRGCVAVFASPDLRARTERLVVVAETRERPPDARAALIARIHALGTELLGAPPEEVLLVPPHTVPKTSSGKLRRSACRAAYEQGRLELRPRAVPLQLLHIRWLGILPALRNALSQLGSWSYAAYAWLCFAWVAVIAWLVVLPLPKLAWRIAVARVAARVLGWLTFTPLFIEGLERLPPGPCVFVANHQSNVDPFVLFGALPVSFSVVAKAELSHHWWTRIPLNRLGVEYVEREVTPVGLADARRIGEHARAGAVPLFFPEGTHSRIPGLLPFRMGAFVTAATALLPIVPVVIEGTRSILRSDTYLPRRGPIKVTVGDPIQPSGTTWEAALQLKQATHAFMLAQTREPDLA